MIVDNAIRENTIELKLGDKRVILIKTAHVSPKSVEDVKTVIETEKPDSVCIELDEGRYKSVHEQENWKNMDVVKIIKSGKTGYFFATLILSNYQRKIAEQFNIRSGQEMMQAIESANNVGATIVLADRDIQITFNRIWRGSSFLEKGKLIFSILYSMLDDEKITEADLENLMKEDMLSAALSELSDSFGSVKQYLVTERDEYLAEKIRTAPGKNIVAVIGAAHSVGVVKAMNTPRDISELEKVPPKSKWGSILGWSIPLILVLIVAYTFFISPDAGMSQSVNWLLWTSILAGIGALVGGGHILSIMTAVLMAPISALNPVLAAGWFSGIAEARVRKPKVEDFEKLPKDIVNLKGIWRNKVTKVLLVTMMTNVGCAIGNIVGSINIINIFLQNIH